MQSNRSVCFFLFLIFIIAGININGVTAIWGQCGKIPKSSAPVPFVYHEEAMELELALEDLLSASFDNDTIAMDRALKSLEKLKISDENADSVPTMKAPIVSTADRIEQEGYPAETHVVITEDGYVLELLRIPYSPQSPKTDKPKRPVFMMHGLLESANGWTVLGSQNSLAYLLADAGYDVWMGNARGTERSRKHIALAPTGKTSKQFWSFSWHEIGIYDIPASIDYVLNMTSQERLHYIGYSQGTTSYLAMASTRPEYNKKIIAANLIAPAAFLQYIKDPFDHFLTWFYTPIKMTLDTLGIYEISVYNRLLLTIGESACHRSIFTTPLTCRAVLALFESTQINCTALPLILAHTPAGASVRQIIHYAQLIRGNDFKLFDYDSTRMNKKIYGTAKPPKYNLKNISTEVNLFYSKDDATATLANVMRIQSELPNVKKLYMVPVDKFNHVDFIYSVNLKKGLNDKVVETINEFDAKL